MINPTSPFGGPEVVPATEAEVPPGRSRRTVVIAVAAGVVALGLLGGTATLVLGGEPVDGTVGLAPAVAQPVVEPEPSASPTAASTPLPTAPVLGRNVFVPLVDPPSGGAADGAADGAASDAAGEAAGGAAAGTAGVAGQASTQPNPTVTVVETVPVLVPGPTQTVPGPERIVEKTIKVAGADFHSLSISVVQEGTEYLASFTVEGKDGQKQYDGLKVGDRFGEDDEFRYVGYDGSAVSFVYVDSMLTVTVALTPLDGTGAEKSDDSTP